MKKGLIQVYTGDGKGKTTAALGLACRAASYGRKVLIFQYLKPADIKTGERLCRSKCPFPIEIQALNVSWNLKDKSKNAANIEKIKDKIRESLEKIAALAKNKQYDLIILDEINVCLSLALADIEDVKALVKNRAGVELVFTGRNAPKELIKIADLVTEMKNIKHPFDKGVKARKGIEF